MMAISIFFSINLYSVSVQELNRGFRRQGVFIDRLPGGAIPLDTLNQFTNDRLLELNEARAHILGRLILTNVFILVGGYFLSYYLARRTLRPIEESHEALERFTADASHELRTPIAAMQTEIEVTLMNPNLTLKQAKQQLKSNLEELARLTALSEGLLKLASLENDSIEKKPASLKKMILESTDRAKALAKTKNLKIITTLPNDAMVLVDRASIIEVITILVDNAIKYSPKNSSIEVKLQLTKSDVRIDVIDQGIGIKPSELSHIFERFYRADSARSKQHNEGHGLGLSIAKNIIELHDGSIEVKSKVNHGSTFILRLPLNT